MLAPEKNLSSRLSDLFSRSGTLQVGVFGPRKPAEGGSNPSSVWARGAKGPGPAAREACDGAVAVHDNVEGCVAWIHPNLGGRSKSGHGVLYLYK